MHDEDAPALAAEIAKVEAHIAQVDATVRQRNAALVARCRERLASGQSLPVSDQWALLAIVERALSEVAIEFERQLDN